MEAEHRAVGGNTPGRLAPFYLPSRPLASALESKQTPATSCQALKLCNMDPAGKETLHPYFPTRAVSTPRPPLTTM